ncbi:hypothetical protein DUI87_21322 [Hirundo rustica rustica]|uniref:Uncharacterized protein n=1 Tax=Hirundo rustica rustica TaxID=333673 RepID=A0A3M0JN60_HIRRU|nr:hypothetical protein DUI87_21322 [Hirundo rustica rustica]
MSTWQQQPCRESQWGTASPSPHLGKQAEDERPGDAVLTWLSLQELCFHLTNPIPDSVLNNGLGGTLVAGDVGKAHMRNLSAKHKWQDALSEGVNGLGHCGGRGVPWGDADAGDRPQARLHPVAGDKGEAMLKFRLFSPKLERQADTCELIHLGYPTGISESLMCPWEFSVPDYKFESENVEA